ncbi:hypothetical protein JTB14_020274 [Gonioctena quinquepunctata]|nr:hypothetical protein JTB14_020274 [Gonioctena quinquepunctata]
MSIAQWKKHYYLRAIRSQPVQKHNNAPIKLLHISISSCYRRCRSRITRKPIYKPLPANCLQRGNIIIRYINRIYTLQEMLLCN